MKNIPTPVSAAVFAAALSSTRRDGFRPEAPLQTLASEAQLLQTTIGTLPTALRSKLEGKPFLHTLAEDVWTQYHASEIGRRGTDISKPLYGVDLQAAITGMSAEGRRRISSICGIVQSMLNSFQSIHAAALRLSSAYKTHALPFFGIDGIPTEETVEGQYCQTLNGTIELVLQVADRGVLSAQSLLLSLRTLESDTAALARAFVVDGSAQ